MGLLRLVGGEDTRENLVCTIAGASIQDVVDALISIGWIFRGKYGEEAWLVWPSVYQAFFDKPFAEGNHPFEPYDEYHGLFRVCEYRGGGLEGRPALTLQGLTTVIVTPDSFDIESRTGGVRFGTQRRP